MTYTYAELQTLLQNEVVSVTFTKADGTTRVMKCTLLQEHLPVVSLDENKKARPENVEVPNQENQERNFLHMIVWDIENQGWRSFRIDSIKKVEVV
jgi:hypothetical protein